MDKLLKIKKISGFIFSIGDSFNDIPMFEKSDISITFHSSPLSVREKAKLSVEKFSDILNYLD